MTDTPPLPPVPEMIDRNPIDAWSVAPRRDPDEPGSRIGVGAIIASMLGPDGLAAVPAVELAFPTAVVDNDGVVRLDAATGRMVGEYLIRAAVVAERGESR